MAMSAADPRWRAGILDQLRRRDKVVEGLRRIIDAHNRLYAKNRAAREAKRIVEAEISDLRTERKTLLQQVSRAEDEREARFAVSNSKDIEAKDRRIAELTTELLEFQKQKSEEVVRERDLWRQKEGLERQVEQQKAQLVQHSQEAGRLDAENEELRTKLSEKERELNTLNGELTALQLELCTTEEKFKKKKDEYDKLITRYIKEKEATMAKMQAEVDSDAARKRAAGKKALAEAAKQHDVHDAALERISTGASGIVQLPTKMVHSFEPHSAAVTCCRFGHGRMATGSADRTINIYDGTGAVANRLRNHTGEVTCLEFHPTAERLVSGAADSKIFIYSLETMRSIHTLNNHKDRITSLVFNHDGTLLFTAGKDHKINMFSGTSGKYQKSTMTGSTCLALGMTGSCLVSGHFDKALQFRDIRLADWKKVQAEITTGHTALITGLMVEPAGNKVMTYARDHTIREFDTRMYDVVATYRDSSFAVGSFGCHAAYSPDGSMIASGTDAGEVVIWSDDAVEGRLSKGGHTDQVIACAWKPGGQELVTVGKDKKVIFWGS